MATHIWEQVRELADGKLCSWFYTETLATAAGALSVAAGKLHNPVAMYTWIGYAVETVRQSGAGVSLQDRWEAACRSGHQYSYGRNANNYELAGRALVQQLEQWWVEWQKGDTTGQRLAKLLESQQPTGLHCLTPLEPHPPTPSLSSTQES